MGQITDSIILNGVLYERCPCCGAFIAKRTGNIGVRGSKAVGPCADSSVSPHNEPRNEPHNNTDNGLHVDPDSDLDGDPHTDQHTDPDAGRGVECDVKSCGDSDAQETCEGSCDGICILHDTGTCGGDNCRECKVRAAGLCCKRYLKNNRQSDAVEKDGGDYRALIGKFMRRKQEDAAFDAKIRRILALETDRDSQGCHKPIFTGVFRAFIFRSADGGSQRALQAAARDASTPYRRNWYVCGV